MPSLLVLLVAHGQSEGWWPRQELCSMGKPPNPPSLKWNHGHQETCWRKFILLFRIAQPPARIQSPPKPPAQVPGLQSALPNVYLLCVSVLGEMWLMKGKQPWERHSFCP